MADLERTGVSLVVENANKAISDLTSFNKALGQTEKATASVGKGGFKGLDISGVLSKNLPALNKLNGTLGQFIPGLSSATTAANGLQGVLAAGLTPAVIGTAAAFAGAVLAIGGFVKLGQRAAQLQPVLTAFGNLSSQLGNSTDVLNQLRTDTRGLVSDFDLMQKATYILSGASQDLIGIFSQQDTSIGKVIDKVGILGNALGIGAVNAQERFIGAIKKGERELIDELGIIVGAEEANKKYAESIGVSADALTAQQKQAAFAKEAILQLDEAVRQAGGSTALSISDLLRIPAVAVTNILDKLALSIRSSFQPIALFVANIFNAIQKGFTYVYPVVQALSDLFGTIFVNALDVAKAAVNALLGPFIRLAGDIIPYVIAAFRLMTQAIGTAIHFVSSIVIKALNTFSAIRDKIFGDTSASVEQLAFTLARGGGFIIGSFAAGLLTGGRYVVIAVTKIAQIVADFLQGFSPPKKGPLSDIDEGGENVAKSWIEGFTGQFLKPVEQVAAEVQQALGVIATFTKEQVESRLAALADAIQPFVDQAKIAKAQFEAIAGFIDPALEALDRQRKIALEQFAQGKISAEQLRALDAQFAKLSEFKAEQQAVSDAAAIQLALAQAQQAEEKALLEIQLEHLNAVEETAAATEEALDAAAGGGKGGKPEEEKPPKEEKPQTGSGEVPQEAAAAAPFTGGAAPDLLSNEAIDHATQVLTSGFNKGLEDAGFDEALAGFTSATGELGTQLARVAESDPVKDIVSKFDGLTEGVGSIVDQFKSIVSGIGTAIANVATVATTFLDVIKRAFDNVLGSAGVQRIIGDVNMVIDTISERIGLLAAVVPTFLETILNAFREKIRDGVTDIIVGLVGEEGLQKITTVIEGIAATIGDKLAPIKAAFELVFGGEGLTTGIKGLLESLVSPEGILGENGAFIGAIDAIFVQGGLIDQAIANVPAAFNQLATDITTAITNIATAFSDLVTTGVPNALSGLASSLESSLIQPLEEMLNKAIQTINDTLPDQVGFGITIDIPTIDLGPLGSVGGGTASATISIDLPDNPIPNPFKAAKGGMGLKGLGIVGEKGAELVNFGSGGADVIPANMTKQLIATANAMGRTPNQAHLDKIMAKYGHLLGMLGTSQPIPLRPNADRMGGTTSIDRSRNIQATFNNTSQSDSILIMRQLEALG